MLRKCFVTVCLFAALLAMARQSYACQTVSVTTGKTSVGFTRLHSDLLTEDSPMSWWKQNREKVLSGLALPEKAGGSHELLYIGKDSFSEILFNPSTHVVQDGGEFKQFADDFVTVCASIQPNRETLEGIRYGADEMAVIAKLGANAKACAATLDAGRAVSDMEAEFNAALLHNIRPEDRRLAEEISGELRRLAMNRMAKERHLMSRLHEMFPERVLVDAVLLTIYANDKTFQSLPEFNFEYFYSGYDRNAATTREECQAILREAGAAALPYIDRALVELSGYKYKPMKERAAEREEAKRQKVSTWGMGPKTQREDNRLKDQRLDGTLEPTPDTDNPTQVEVDGAQDIPVNCQLIPMALDFKWVFNAEYNTRFYRNDDAVSVLRKLYDEIAAGAER